MNSFRSPPAGAIRKGDWKLIEFFEDSRIEPYNLKEDISEKPDLVGANPDKAKERREMLRDCRVRVNAPIPTTPNSDFAPESLVKPQPTGKSRKKGQQP